MMMVDAAVAQVLHYITLNRAYTLFAASLTRSSLNIDFASRS